MSKKHVIPFINNFIVINKDLHVLEIGCGEAGNLKPFLDIGCNSIGGDLNNEKVNYAKVITPASVLPFRLTLTNVGIEGYNPANPPGIGIQIIGFSNYIL